VALVEEDLHRRLALGQQAEHVGLQRLLVRPLEVPGAQRLSLAEARVGDHPVDPAQLGTKVPEHGEHRIVIGHVELPGDHADARVVPAQLPGELVDPLDAPRTQRQVAPFRGELPGHFRTEAGAGPGDEDVLPDGPALSPCRYRASSMRETTARCTSSGPSASRRARAQAAAAASGKSSVTPAAPCSWMAKSMTSCAIAGTAALIWDSSDNAPAAPLVSSSHAVCSTCSRAWLMAMRALAIRSR